MSRNRRAHHPDVVVQIPGRVLAVEPNSRLSCQIICSETTDGIKVTVAPE
jgi:2Fe-2S ferredoxin